MNHWPWWALFPLFAMFFWMRGGHSRHRRRLEAQVAPQEDPRVNELETRVAELENRLDFTERLLAGRGPAELSRRPAEGYRSPESEDE